MTYNVFNGTLTLTQSQSLASSCEEAAAEANLVPSNLTEGSSSKPAGTATGVKTQN